MHRVKDTDPHPFQREKAKDIEKWLGKKTDAQLNDLRTALSPSRFIGRSAQQVSEFLAEVVAPLLATAGPVDAAPEEVRV